MTQPEDGDQPTVEPLVQGVLDDFGLEPEQLFGFVLLVDHVALDEDGEPGRRLSVRYSTVLTPWVARGMLRQGEDLL